MTARLLKASAEKSFRESGGEHYSLSVWSSPDLDAEGIAKAAREQGEEYLPHGRMQTSTVGLLRSLGYGLIPTDPPGHYSLMLPTPPTDEDWDNLMEAFDDPQPNPVAR